MVMPDSGCTLPSITAAHSVNDAPKLIGSPVLSHLPFPLSSGECEPVRRPAGQQHNMQSKPSCHPFQKAQQPARVTCTAALPMAASTGSSWLSGDELMACLMLLTLQQGACVI